MRLTSRPGLTPGRITGVYLLVGLGWLLLSDRLVAAFVPLEAQAMAQFWKGVGFVVVSAFALFVLLHRAAKRQRQYENRLTWNLQQVSVLQRVMRHDIRTVSNILLGYAELLDDEVPPDCRPYLNTILEQSERLVRLSEKTGRMSGAGGEFDGANDVGTVIELVCRELGEQFPNATITTDLPWSTSLVSARMETIVRELVENAAKHGGNGVSVSVRLRADRETMTLVIEDDGPGLPELEWTVLGRELEGPLTHSRGIGLWIVRLLVADANGTFTIEDREPTGTQVTVTLPREPEDGAPSGNPLIHGIQARA